MIATYPTKSNFNGGMNRLAEPTALLDSEYSLLINGRTRFGGVTPIKQPLEISTVVGPTDKLQGVYTADTYQLIFVSGRAYIRNFALASSQYNQVIGFQMDTQVDTIYACLVPASSVNFKRQLTDASKKEGTVNLIGDAQQSSPACIVCQDGVNQPFLIFSDGTCRQAKQYNQWLSTDREYVPIGRQMLYSPDGILYVVAKNPTDGRYTLLLHSVTGRPLDFVVNVTAAGDKGGDAFTVAYSVDFSEITCIAPLNLVDKEGFFASTLKNSYIVLPNEVNTLFAEPTYSNITLFNTGALNQFSITDLLGDTALIDSSGIKSFNAVEQLRNRGQNAPFSTKVQPFLENILQDVTAAITFDNYAFFAVTTIHGEGILVYDTLLQQWTSLDLHSSVEGKIKQFASIDTVNYKALFFITDENKMYQAFAGTTYATCSLYAGEYMPDDSNKEQKPLMLNLVFVDVEQSGTVNATCYLDSQQDTTLNQAITQTTEVQPTVRAIPFGSATRDKVRNPSYDFSTVSYGWKTGFFLQWNFNAKLVAIKYKADLQNTNNSFKEQARDFGTLNTLLKSVS